MHLKISVVIVAYKNFEVLLRCMNSIDKYNDIGGDLELIIVDNSPKDERVENEIKRSNFKGYRYIKANNDGFGAGNNIGESVASGEIVAFLNPDIILIEPIFKKVIHRFETNENLALLGGKLLYEDLSDGFSFYYDYKSSFVSKQMIKVCNKANHFNPKSMYISGANLFFRKSVFEKIGKFDENIFMYFEEPDLTRRIKQTFPNMTVEFDKNIRMIHLERKSTPNSLFLMEQNFKSAIYYGKKFSLDYKSKLKNEYNYLKFKRTVYRLLHKTEQTNQMNELISELKEKYMDNLEKL